MRKTVLTFLMAAVLAAPALADVGSIYMDLKSGGQDSVTLYSPTGDPCVADIPVELYISATTSGVDGANLGLAVIFTDIVGDCLSGIMQQSMTPSADFADPWAPYDYYYPSWGCGFDLFPANTTGGTGSVGIIAGVGNAQNSEGNGPIYAQGDLKWAATAKATKTVSQPPLLIATGVLHVSVPYQGAGTVITTDTVGALWNLDLTYDAMDIGDARLHDDSLTIVCIPEPTTLLLLAPALLAIRRRRR